MCRTFSKIIPVAGLLFFSNPALSADGDGFLDSLTIVAGVTNIAKTADFTAGIKPFKLNFISLDWSITAAYKNFYVKMNFDESIKDHHQVNNTPNGNGGFDNGLLSMSREDNSTTIGYGVTDNISVFAGYKYGKTGGTATSNINSTTINDGVNPPFELLWTENTSLHFEEKGPFIGVNYSHALANSGAFSFSLAFASLDGEVLFRNVQPDETTGLMTVFRNDLTPGDTTGLSFSISWTDQLVESINYTVALKTTRYEFDSEQAADPNGELDTDLIFNNLSIGFSKFF